MQKFTWLVISLILSLASAVWALPAATSGAPPEKPLYLSYEQRLIMTYLLAGAGESEAKQIEIADRLEKTLKKMINLPQQTLQVKSFEEFLHAYQGPWPNSFSVESDLQLIEAGQLRGMGVYHAVDSDGQSNSRLQAQINNFIAVQDEALRAKTTENVLHTQLANLSKNVGSLISAYRSGDLAQARTKRYWILQSFSKTSDLLNEQLQMIQATGAAVAQSGQMASKDAAMTLFLETIFKEYFGRLGLKSKKQIISQFIGSDLNANALKRFEMMVMNSGPQFQKLLQVVARDAGISADLLQTFKRLESKANPIPPAIVKSLFESERNRYHWVSYETDPVGTGTMAQVNRGKIATSGGDKDVVIRFLKPEIHQRIDEDYRILSEIAPIMDLDPRFRNAGFPKLAPVLNDLNQTVLDELDLQATIERQTKGRQVYNRRMFFKGVTYKNYIDLNVPAVIDGGKDSQLMVQDMVEGNKLDKEAEIYKESIPDLKKGLMEQIAQVWADEVLFRSGFFHSDLHQGNFMVALTEPAIKVNLLDFGMGGTITREMQIDMLLLGAGLELNRADVITETLWSLSDISSNQTSKDSFARTVQDRMAKIKSGQLPWQRMDQWTAWSMDQGVRYPYSFVSLNRGLVILDKSLQDAGSSKTMASIAGDLAGRSAKVVLFDLRSKGLLSWLDLIKLGWASGRPDRASAQVSAGVGNNSLKPPSVLASPIRCAKIYSHSGLSF